MSAKNIEYITNPSNYVGANPRDKYGQHTKGVYAPIQVDWNNAYKVQVWNDGTNNKFTSQDKYGNTLYSGNLVNGFTLQTDEVDVSVSGGNVYVSTLKNSLYIIENTSTAIAVLTTKESSKVKATCKGTGRFQLISKDNSILEAKFDGGGDAYVDTTQTGSFTAAGSSMMLLTLAGDYEGTTSIQIASKDNSIINLKMQDTAALHGGRNERGIIECYNNGTVNIDMQDNAEVVATGSNQSYFALNAQNSANINLKMRDNALIKCGNTNAYALNVYSIDASFDLDMSGNAKIQISSAPSSARAVWVKGGEFNIKMSENATITCGGNGSNSCFAVGGQKDTYIKLILKDNAILTNGKTSGKQGNFADIAAGAMGSNPCYITVYDSREVNSANQVSFSINGASGSQNAVYQFSRQNVVCAGNSTKTLEGFVCRGFNSSDRPIKVVWSAYASDGSDLITFDPYAGTFIPTSNFQRSHNGMTATLYDTNADNTQICVIRFLYTSVNAVSTPLCNYAKNLSSSTSSVEYKGKGAANGVSV